MTPETIQTACDEWKARLRLSEWDVIARFSERVSNPGAAAGCSHCGNDRIAKIQVLTEAAYDPEWISPYDAEQSLVHELLELALFRWTPDDATESGKEWAINQIAWALVNLKREQAKK